MEKLNSLEEVNALALPAKVLVLLSKYSVALKSTNGTVIKLSSLRVFKHIHQTCIKAASPALNGIYHELLSEVNKHIAAETMFTNQDKKILLSESKHKKRVLRKYISKSKIERRSQI